jgi:ATP-dependent RNA helicase RhlE
LEDIQKLKVDVKIVSDHPYPWHSGTETASGGSYQNSNRSGGAHKSRKSDASKQNKTLVLTVFFKINKYNIRKVFFIK